MTTCSNCHQPVPVHNNRYTCTSCGNNGDA